MEDTGDANDSKYKSLLTEWGLSAFLENFQIEGITDKSFYLLDDETIKALIPKSGPRLIFKQLYANHVNEKPIVIENYTESNASTDTLESSSIYTFVPDDVNFANLLATSSPNVTRYSNTSPAESAEKLLKSNVGQSSTTVDHVQPAKKHKLNSVFPQGLEAALNKYPDGQLVLLKRDKLSNDLRTKLTKIVISELFGHYGINDIKADLLKRVSEEIESIFPSEIKDTYYIPYDSEKKKGPKGKLYTKFVNTKSSLKLANACIAMEKTDNRENKENMNPDNELEDGYITFLKVGVEPYTKVLEAWEGCFKLRRKLYLNSELSRIYEDFPCLKLNQGLELIETDFNKRHPDCVDIIYHTWQKVCSSIIAEVRERKLNDYGINTDDSVKTLLVLPYLFSPVTIKKCRKGCIWRPSRSEVQESFFYKVENVNALNEILKTKRKKLSGYGLTVQPFGAIIGDLSSPSFIIVVDDIFYNVDTGVRALELLFKLFHALDIEYPPECAHVWQFLEQAVFKMKIKNHCPAASALLADISYHMQTV